MGQIQIEDVGYKQASSLPTNRVYKSSHARFVVPNSGWKPKLLLTTHQRRLQ